LRAIVCLILLLACPLMSNGWPVGAAQGRENTLTGDIRTHRNFHSRFLTSDRDIIVYVPPGYEQEKRRRYPVLYMHDGQNIFDGATSFIPGIEWCVDETAEKLITSGEIQPLIIVGVYNAGRDRVDEYTPTRDAEVKRGGRADLYGRMLVEELKPFIDSQYRTRRGMKETGLGGSSLGGLVSLYLGLKYPKVFGRLAVVSPSVWWDNKMIIREVQALKGRLPLRIWMDMGTKESRNPADATTAARALRDALVAKGWKENADLKYFEAVGATHDEKAWAERVAPMLKFLFGKK
jgi:predicted alpha/beta superfamily hydrolase